jgi:superfamily I DNA/RNA helicase
MDAVEIGRRRAAALFHEAEAAGIDAWQPYEVARFAARSRGVSVEKVAKGHVGLGGGRANYDPEFRSILHEDTGSSFSDAFLVAHEIGHVVLGDDKVANAVTDVDEERVADASPVGVDRVEDYGRSQRREIQMDLFAREVLLPRQRVRELHLNGGLGATQIATGLGATFGPVAQQLFDALLLPEIAEAAAPPRPDRPLNEEQKASAEHSGGPFLLEAGPGTGKTQTLVGRIEWLLANGVDPRRILVLTFSNKAAGELVERISARSPDAAVAMWCGTFHAFGLDFIKRYAEQIDMPASPVMIDRSEAITMLETELPRLGLVHYRNLWDPTQQLNDILQAVSRAKDEVASPSDYRDLAEAMEVIAKSAIPNDPKAVETAEKAVEVARVYERYEALKLPGKLLDFGDLVSLPVRTLETRPEIQASLAALYDHVLVDEYQDVNRSSVRLLKAIVGAGQNLWVVGDIKQSIYRFRGASSVNIDLFAKQDFPGASIGRLTVNYRSSSEIVEAFSDFADEMKATDGRASRLTSDRGPSGYQPEFRRAARAAEEVAAVVEAIQEMRALGYSYRDQAVLCTGNEKLARFGAGLESMGVPILYLGSVFERPEIKNLLSLLGLVADSKALGLTRVATLPSFPMSLSDVAAIVAELRSGDAAWQTVPLPLTGLSPEGQSSLMLIRTVLQGFNRASRPWDVLAKLLLDRTTMAADLARSPGIAERAAGIAIWQLMNFIRTARGSKSPIHDLFDRIRRLVSIADDRDLRQLPPSAQELDAVRLMTVHGSKGLEFPVVHLPGLTAASLPRSSRQIQGIPPPDGLVKRDNMTGIEVRADAHDEEQECLFYVALSRARDRLIAYAPSISEGDARMKHSPFLDRIVSGPTDVSPLLTVPVAAEDRPIQVVFEEVPAFTGHQIQLYEKCPRRFFYTHLLRVGGRQTETSFVRMHNAVRAVVDWMLTQDPASVDAAETERRLIAAFDAARFGESERPDYLEIARTLLSALHLNRTGQERRPVVELAFPTPHGSIVVRPDEALVDRDGNPVVRSIRTGHATSKSMEDLAAAAFVLAADKHPDRPRAHLVYLADETFDPIALTPRQVENKRIKIGAVMEKIGRGAFGIEASSRTCPRCPAFFFCGDVPAGTLTKKVGSTLPNSPTASD